jgi:hypothetical protein
MSPSSSAVDMAEYQPGQCNIGRVERRKRRVVGVLGVAGTAVYVGWLLATGQPPGRALGTFPLLFAGLLGLLQDRLRFCVGFAALARYDLSGSGGGAGKSTEAELVRRDRMRALQILAYAFVGAAAGTAVVYALATLV